MDPFTIAIVAALAVSAVTAAGAAAYTGYAQHQAAKYNASVQERMAEQQRLEAELAAEQEEREGRRRAGQVEADFAAGGLAGAGSALDVLTDQLLENERARRYALFSGERASAFSMAQARGLRMQGQQALVGGALGAAGSLAGGGAKAVQASGGGQ